MKLVKEPISLSELKKMAVAGFGNLVKAVVDVEREIMAVDAELHADQEQLLLENGSSQEHLWGVNFYPEKCGQDEWLEFDSMINLRPHGGNLTRGVDSPDVQKKINRIVNKLVKK